MENLRINPKDIPFGKPAEDPKDILFGKPVEIPVDKPLSNRPYRPSVKIRVKKAVSLSKIGTSPLPYLLPDWEDGTGVEGGECPYKKISPKIAF